MEKEKLRELYSKNCELFDREICLLSCAFCKPWIADSSIPQFCDLETWEKKLQKEGKKFDRIEWYKKYNFQGKEKEK